ncbi:MAG: DUF1707 SHOCT-like domain-containing protein [Acidimicrobiales bacterium]
MAEHPELRASDGDRERTVEQLRRHLGEGRLTLEEFEDRAAHAYAAKTIADLTPVLADLPTLAPKRSGPPMRQRAPKPAKERGAMRSPAFRMHLYIWVVLVAFFVVLGIATAGIWPVYPIAGIGLSVGIHAAVLKALE